MKKNIKKILSLVMIIYMILYLSVGTLLRNKTVNAETESETTQRTGHTQKEAGDTIAAWCIAFHNKHKDQCYYPSNPIEGGDRELAYSRTISDSDTTTRYGMDCVGFVSFALHQALGIGAEQFSCAVVPPNNAPWGTYWTELIPSNKDTEPGNYKGLEVNMSEWKPGDVIIMGHHVAIYVGDGKSMGMHRNGLYYGSAEDDCNWNQGYTGLVARINPSAASSAKFASLVGTSETAQLQMKGNKIADCAWDYDEGKPGDTNGDEWQITNWRNTPEPYQYNTVYRHPDENVAKTIAIIAIKCANNDNIGYNDGDRRGTFYDELAKVNFNVDAVNTKCDTNRPWGVSAVVKAAGYALNNEKLKGIPQYSSTAEADYSSRGFNGLTDQKYKTSCSELIAGDILFTSPNNVFIFVGNGEIRNNENRNDSNISYEIDDIKVNLDEQYFSFAGLPKTVTYNGTQDFGEWTFSLIAQFLDFIIGVILVTIKNSILGYFGAFEALIDTAIKFLSGYQ